VLAVEKLAGLVKASAKVNLAKTYTNAFVVKANKQLGYTK
jgi:hypothetical protein